MRFNYTIANSARNTKFVRILRKQNPFVQQNKSSKWKGSTWHINLHHYPIKALPRLLPTRSRMQMDAHGDNFPARMREPARFHCCSKECSLPDQIVANATKKMTIARMQWTRNRTVYTILRWEPLQKLLFWVSYILKYIPEIWSIGTWCHSNIYVIKFVLIIVLIFCQMKINVSSFTTEDNLPKSYFLAHLNNTHT